MEAAGIELPTHSTGKSHYANQSGAESGALGAQSNANPVNATHCEPKPIDSDLAAIIAAWPTLPEAMKAGILAMVRAAK